MVFMMKMPAKITQNRLQFPYLAAILASFCLHGLVFALVYWANASVLRNAVQLIPSNPVQKSPLRIEMALAPNAPTQPKAPQPTPADAPKSLRPNLNTIKLNTTKPAQQDNIAPSSASQTASSLVVNAASTLGNKASAQEETVTFSAASYQLGVAATPKPIYPEASILYAESGSVLLQLEIDAEGKVSAMQLARSSGFKRLDKAAMNTVKHWIFAPALRNQIAVASQKKVAIRFELIDSAAIIR